MPALQVCVNLLVSWQNDFKTEVESKTFSEAMHQKVKTKKRKVVKSILIGKSKLILFKVNVKINN